MLFITGNFRSKTDNIWNNPKNQNFYPFLYGGRDINASSFMGKSKYIQLFYRHLIRVMVCLLEKQNFCGIDKENEVLWTKHSAGVYEWKRPILPYIFA